MQTVSLETRPGSFTLFIVLNKDFGIPGIPGNYVFYNSMDLTELGSIKPIYIGTTNNLLIRLSVHERWDEAVRLSADSIATNFVEQPHQRLIEEKYLISQHNPDLNVHYRDPTTDISPNFIKQVMKHVSYSTPMREVMINVKSRANLI